MGSPRLRIFMESVPDFASRSLRLCFGYLASPGCCLGSLVASWSLRLFFGWWTSLGCVYVFLHFVVLCWRFLVKCTNTENKDLGCWWGLQDFVFLWKAYPISRRGHFLRSLVVLLRWVACFMYPRGVMDTVLVLYVDFHWGCEYVGLYRARAHHS